jgi:hypothetical protein
VVVEVKKVIGIVVGIAIAGVVESWWWWWSIGGVGWLMPDGAMAGLLVTVDGVLGR